MVVSLAGSLALLLAACSDDPADPTDPQLAEQCDDDGGLTLPSGFCSVVVTRNAALARHLAIRPNGDVYVAMNNAPNGGAQGGILAFRDTDGDGKADVIYTGN